MLSKKIMILITVIAIVVVICAVLGVWHFVFSRPNPPLHTTRMTIGSTVFSVEVASTTIEQTRGLSGRAQLGQNEGMLFLFNSPSVQNFWMKDMNFAIDMIWIGGGKVLGFAENAVPQPGVPLWGLKIYSSPTGVDTVLEVNAGTVAKDGIRIGDPVVISGSY
jgi:uncharacterized membrane protein (UPF0127 family)